jgi:hypothetical protein
MLIPRLLTGLAILLNSGAMAATLASSLGTHELRFSIRDFGAVGDGVTLDTEAIERAVVAANKAGGGTVVFSPGVYLSGTFELLSNVTLEVDAGSVIQGSTNVADYKHISDFGFGRTYGVDYTGEGTHVGLIVAQNAENIAIVGKGAIDGASNAFFDFTRPHYSLDFDPKVTRQGQGFLDAVLETGDGPAAVKPTDRAGTMIIFSNSKNVLLRDITLRSAPNWTVHLANVHGGVFDGVHVINDLRIPNNDGVDCIGCRDVHFSNSDFRTGDDDFAIVGSEDITVTNCSMVSNSSAIRLEDSRYSVFSNLTIHANRGIGIYERGKGTTSSVLFSNIAIDTHLLTGHWWGKGEPIYIATGQADGVGGTVHDVRFSNIVAEAENGIMLFGDPNSWIHEISFDHIVLHMRVTRKDVNAKVGGNFDLRWTSKNLSNAVFKHDIPGFYGRYLNGLHLDSVAVKWAEDMPAYYSSALQFDDVEQLDINGFQGRQAAVASSTPVIDIHRAKDITIRNSSAEKGSSTFLAATDTSGKRLLLNNELAYSRSAQKSNPPFISIGNLP